MEIPGAVLAGALSSYGVALGSLTAPAARFLDAAEQCLAKTAMNMLPVLL